MYESTWKIQVIPLYSSLLSFAAVIPIPGFHHKHLSLLPCRSILLTPGLALSIHLQDLPA